MKIFNFIPKYGRATLCMHIHRLKRFQEESERLEYIRLEIHERLSSLIGLRLKPPGFSVDP